MMVTQQVNGRTGNQTQKVWLHSSCSLYGLKMRKKKKKKAKKKETLLLGRVGDGVFRIHRTDLHQIPVLMEFALQCVYML